MEFELDQALAMEPLSAGRFALNRSDRFWNYDSAFGGWQASACAKAVRESGDARGQVVTQQIMFVAPARGQHFRVDVTLLERRRSVDFWQVILIDSDSDAVCASSQVAMGERRDTSIAFQQEIPQLPGPERSFALEAGENLPTWFGHFDIRVCKGRPFRQNETPDSATWIRERDGRPLDDTVLLAMCDTPMPRTFFCNDQRVPASTISLGTHIYATPAQLTGVGNDYVLLETMCKVIRDGLINQETALYSRDGLLLAMSYQTATFRERSGA